MPQIKLFSSFVTMTFVTFSYAYIARMVADAGAPLTAFTDLACKFTCLFDLICLLWAAWLFRRRQLLDNADLFVALAMLATSVLVLAALTQVGRCFIKLH